MSRRKPIPANKVLASLSVISWQVSITFSSNE
ncbi:hypothetical protein D043_2275A, partial [Vibrio parahaemolyticus EKP-021]